MPDFKLVVQALLKCHGLDNQKQDLLYVNPSRTKLIKVKILNPKVLCASQTTADMQHCIKVFFNVMGDSLNEHVLRLLEEINKTHMVTDGELEVTHAFKSSVVDRELPKGRPESDPPEHEDLQERSVPAVLLEIRSVTTD